MALEFIVVDNRTVMAGGTTSANLPAAAKNARRSSPSFDCSSDMASSFVSQGLLTQLPSRVEGGPNPLNRRVPFLTTVATPRPAGVDAVATFDVVRLRRPNITEGR